MSDRSLSIVIPCFNEAGNIEDTLREITASLKGIIDDYEMLIFNDCSTDRTREVIEQLAKTYPNVKAVHNSRNMGIGYNYRQGLAIASKKHIVMFPGDNETHGDSIREICSHIGEADIVIPYIENFWIRPLHRQALSRMFTYLVNLACGYSLRYYNGTVVHKVEIIRSIELDTDGFAYQAEILIQLLRRGCTYVEVPMILRPRSYGSSRALSRKNILSVGKALVKMFVKGKQTALKKI